MLLQSRTDSRFGSLCHIQTKHANGLDKTLHKWRAAQNPTKQLTDATDYIEM